MKSCDEVMVVLATRKDASPAQEEQLRAHLAECSTCAAQWEVEERTSRTLRLLQMPPPQMVEYVVDRSDQRIERAVGRGIHWLPARRGGLALAGMLLAVALVFIGVSAVKLQRSPVDGTARPAVGGPGSTKTASSAASQPTVLPTSRPEPTQAQPGEQQTSTGTPTTQAGDASEQAVRQVVGQLGEQLHMVSLLAPPEVLSETMPKHYAPYVSADLLKRWLQEPLKAPGRLTSSPWPERITISSMRRMDEARYVVEGAIVQVASTEGDSVSDRVSIQLTVEKREDRWLITEYSAQPGGLSAKPDTSTDALEAAQTIYVYYDAINEGRYQEAYHYWKESGAASGQSFSEFQEGYLSTLRVSVILGEARPAEDSRSVEVDTQVLAVINDPGVPTTGQRVQVFSGTYTLEAAGTGEDSRTSWLIASAKLQEVSAALPPDGFQTAEQTLSTYHEAINRGAFALAFTAWERPAQARDQLLDELHIKTIAGVSFEHGAAQMSAGAGNVYARIPVILAARRSDGSQQIYCGFYELHRANQPPFDQLGWRIQKAQLAPTDPVSLNTEQSRRLLEGGCPTR